MVHKFEKLRVWTEATEFIKQVYKLCNRLPQNEEGNLKDQLRRAATSVALNIAEGSTAESDLDFNRFLSISRKSQVECIAILRLISNLYQINTDCEVETAENVGKMLHGLVKYLKDKK